MALKYWKCCGAIEPACLLATVSGRKGAPRLPCVCSVAELVAPNEEVFGAANGACNGAAAPPSWVPPSQLDCACATGAAALAGGDSALEGSGALDTATGASDAVKTGAVGASDVEVAESADVAPGFCGPCAGGLPIKLFVCELNKLKGGDVAHDLGFPKAEAWLPG